MPRVRKYHEGGKGPGHPHYTIDNKAERQAADAADYYDRYPERRPEAIAKKKEERGTLFDSAADFFQYSPIIGEIVDLINIPYVAATGKDVYKGEPQSVQSAAAWGVGGLLLPNLIEKPAKWLIKQGAKNADDVASILRHFSNRNAEDIPADLKPLLNFSKKNNEMRAFLSDKSPGFPFAGMDNVGSNKLKDVGGDLHDYIVKNRPDLIDKFSVKNFESGMFDEVTRAWGDEYLVSLRGVRDAKNVDEAAEFLTSAKGGGERVQGPGINTSGSLNQVEPFGSGSEGYIGRLKVNEPYSSSANASTILDNIYNLEKEGGKLIPKSDDSRFLSKSGVTEGINTIDGTQVRVIKENTPVTVEDIIKTEGNDLSKIFRNPSEVTILGNPSVRNADYDKILDWTRSSGGDLNELYNTVLKKGSYKQGGKTLKGLMKKYNEGGEIPEREPDVKDLLHQLNRFGKKPRGSRGSWNMPPDEERQIPRHDDIYKYLASRGIDTKDDEIAKAYIMPGSVAGAGFVDGYDASAYSEKGRYLDPTKPSKPDLMNAGEFGAPPFPNAKGQRIMLASTQLKNPTTRIEEAVHSLQQQRFLDPSVSDSKIGGNKRRLYQMLKKQPWLKELSPDMRKTLTKGNYALRGSGSTSEFEAKLIASKMTMIQDGVLPEDGKVSDKDLEAIKQWYENYQNKTGETLWESVLFQDFSDKKYRDEMLNTLNKL